MSQVPEEFLALSNLLATNQVLLQPQPDIAIHLSVTTSTATTLLSSLTDCPDPLLPISPLYQLISWGCEDGSQHLYGKVWSSPSQSSPHVLHGTGTPLDLFSIFAPQSDTVELPFPKLNALENQIHEMHEASLPKGSHCKTKGSSKCCPSKGKRHNASSSLHCHVFRVTESSFLEEKPLPHPLTSLASPYASWEQQQLAL